MPPELWMLVALLAVASAGLAGTWVLGRTVARRGRTGEASSPDRQRSVEMAVGDLE